MRSAVVATFNDRDHAQPVVKRLEETGFHPRVHDESHWQQAHLAERLASVKVEVEESEYEAARQKLKELDANEHLLEQAVCCPECGSCDVEFPQVTRKFILPSLHTLFYKLGFEEKMFYCQTCHATWPLRDKIEPERDELGWPVKRGKLHQNTDATP